MALIEKTLSTEMRVGIRFLNEELKNATEVHREIVEVFGEM